VSVLRLAEQRESLLSDAAVSPWQTSLRGFAARYGDRVAVSSRGRTLTYTNLAAQADAVRAAVIGAGA
jgi:non-ribosomal peptide synthetase component E (peptide arylation enzyme)